MNELQYSLKSFWITSKILAVEDNHIYGKLNWSKSEQRRCNKLFSMFKRCWYIYWSFYGSGLYQALPYKFPPQDIQPFKMHKEYYCSNAVIPNHVNYKVVTYAQAMEDYDSFAN